MTHLHPKGSPKLELMLSMRHLLTMLPLQRKLEDDMSSCVLRVCLTQHIIDSRCLPMLGS